PVTRCSRCSSSPLGNDPGKEKLNPWGTLVGDDVCSLQLTDIPNAPPNVFEGERMSASGPKRTLAIAQLCHSIVLLAITANEGTRMRSHRRVAILSFAVTMLTLGLERASADECDYRTCGALMARDGSMSWGISGRREYAADTKRACAELNACVRRAKNDSAGRAAAAPAAGSSSSSTLKPQPADKQAKGTQSASTSAVHETSGNGIPNADRSNGKPTPCFAVAEILL